MKKVFIIASTIFILTVVFWGTYNFVFKKKDSFHFKKPTYQNQNGGYEIPEKIYALTKEAVVPSMKIDKKEEVIYFYTPSNQAIYKTSFNGESQRIVDKIKQSHVKSLIWSPNARKIIYQTNKNFYLKQIGDEKEIKLKDGLDLVAWTNLGDKIIYKYYNHNSKERSLNIANPDGNFWQKLALLDYPRIKIAPVPRSVLVSFWNYPQQASATKLKIISLVGKDVKTIFSGLKGADYLWSPNGKKILISSVSDGKLHLGIADSDGKNYRDLNVSTLVSKCAWSKNSQNIYCAEPLNISQSAHLPDDYTSGKIKTRDDFWKINVMTGEKKRLLELEEIRGDYDVSDMQVSEGEDYIFFINRQDEKIYGLKL